MTGEYGYQGTQTLDVAGSQFNAIQFISQMLINGMATATLVQVKAVTNSGGITPVGLVDIQPLLNQLDGFGNPTPHNIIHNCPYFRLQGGNNAIILDPKVGDTGVAIFADRDLSKIIAAQLANSGATSSLQNPDSARRFSFSDGLYIGGFLNGTPNQFVDFSTSGINITSPTAISLNAPDISINAQTIELNGTTSTTITTPILTVNGNVQMNGTVNASVSVTAPLVSGTSDVNFGGKSSLAHIHGGGSIGSGDTTAPL